MREPALDVLGKWLCDVIPDAHAVLVTSLEAPSQGFSNETWFFDAEITSEDESSKAQLVLRMQPETSRTFRDTDVMHQWRVMVGLSQSAVPLPPLLAAEPDSGVLGSPFFVMGRVDGRIPQDVPSYNIAGWVRELQASDRAKAWRNGIDALAEIHGVHWLRSCPFLGDLTRGKPGLDQYLDFLEEWFNFVCAARDLPLLDAAMAEVRTCRPTDAHVGVMWGDARPGNMIYADDLSVAAVLDWEMAALGPGEADLGWWLFADRFYSEGYGVRKLEGLPTRDETILEYEKAASRRVKAIEYFELLAAFRMALIIVRSTGDRISSGVLDAGTTMDSANPAMRIIAELLGRDVPPLSPDFARAVNPCQEKS